MILRKDSWHYWLAKQVCDSYDMPCNLCPYAWTVFFGACWATAIGIMGLILAGLLFWVFGDMIGWLIAGLLGEFVQPEVARAALTLIGIAVGLAGLGAIVYAAKCAGSKIADSTPSFISEVYSSWHDKVCPIIEFRRKS